MTLAGRMPVVAFAFGAASMTYGSIASLPGTFAGQIVVSVAIGATLVLFGSLYLAVQLATRPARADLLLEAALKRSGVQRFAPSLFERIAFAEVPLLRWGLCSALLLVAAFSLALLASDVFAWTRLGWTVPAGAERIILR